MKFFDKVTKIAEKIVNSVEKSATNVSQTYKTKGFEGLVTKTTEGLDSLSKKTQEYAIKIGEKNKEIMEANKSSKIEDKIGAAAAVVVNTTQTIFSDAVKATVSSVQDVAQISTPAPAKKYLTADQLTDAELASLDSTPLSIVLENMGSTNLSDNINNKWKTKYGHKISIDDQVWHNFNSNTTEKNAISLMSYFVSHDNNLDAKNPDSIELISNEALDKLQALHAEADYQIRVSLWLQNEIKNAQTTTKVVKKTAKKSSVIKENELFNDLSQAVPKTTKKSTIKKTVAKIKKAVEPEVKKVKKTIKKVATKKTITPEYLSDIIVEKTTKKRKP